MDQRRFASWQIRFEQDSGNLDLAKEKAEELIKIAPKDDNVQRLLGAINKELDRRGGKVTSAGYGQANSQDVELDMELSSTADASESSSQSTLSGVSILKPQGLIGQFLQSRSAQNLEQVSTTSADAAVAEAAADQNYKIDAAKDAIADAQKLAKLGAYSDALNLLNAASASLTLNTATASKQELERPRLKSYCRKLVP